MDAAMRDRVWSRWVEEHPEDAEFGDRRDIVLDTLTWEMFAIRVQVEELPEPARTIGLAMMEDGEMRVRRMNAAALARALAATA